MDPNNNAFVKIKDDVSSTMKRIKRKSQEISDDIKRVPVEIRQLESTSKETLRGFIDALKDDSDVPGELDIDELVDALTVASLMLCCFWIGSIVGKVHILSLLKPIVDVHSVVVINYVIIPFVFLFARQFERLEREQLCLLAALQGLLMGYVFEEIGDPSLFPLGVLNAVLNVALLRFCCEQSGSDRRKFYALFCSISFVFLMIASKFANQPFVFSLLASGFYAAGTYAVFQLYFKSMRAGRAQLTAFKVGYLTVALYVNTLMHLEYGVQIPRGHAPTKTEL